jgi:hypothetical protein
MCGADDDGGSGRSLEIDEFDLDRAPLQAEQGQADGKASASGTGASRVEIEHPVPLLLVGRVGVTEDDDLIAGGNPGWSLGDVGNVERQAGGRHHGADGEPLGPGADIAVAPDRGQRCQGPQFLENFRPPYVARMQDQVTLLQHLQGSSSQQAMRVGDDSDEVGSGFSHEALSSEISSKSLQVYSLPGLVGPAR